MLARVLERLAAKRVPVELTAVIASGYRNVEGVDALTRRSDFRWLSRLSDDALLRLYRDSHLLVLPMRDSGANTAIVEALSAGLPIVTTDVGGVRDYGGGAFLPVVPPGDDAAMAELIDQYLAQPTWRTEVAVACRRFAETTLAWPAVAKAHMAVYSNRQTHVDTGSQESAPARA